MKRTYVQCAEIELEAEADSAAPGGAVTLALCGSWDHDGPCRWPHETKTVCDDRRGLVRVVFVIDESEEATVRAEIDRALAGGFCVGPDGATSRWQVKASSAGVLTEADKTWAAAITKSAGPDHEL